MLPQTQKIPAELQGRCFKCLSYSHCVATCRLPWCCLRYHGLHHLARECTRPRAMATAAKAKGANLPRQFARGSHLASQHTPRGSSLSSEGAAPRAVWGARGRRGWRRRRTRPMMDIGTGVPANHDESTTPPVVAPCFSEPDPLALALGLEPCTSTVPPTWFDPMLEELDASQVVCHAAGVPALGCPLFQEV
jgi:hypothetical protein